MTKKIIQKVLLFFLIVCIKTINCQERRLVILIDKEEELIVAEQKNEPSKAITAIFAINIHQKASAVIAPFSIVDSFFKRLNGQAPELFSKLPAGSSIKFDSNEWNVYAINNSYYFLFVPKVLAASYASVTPAFNDTNMTIMEDSENIANFISNYSIEKNKSDPLALSAVDAIKKALFSKADTAKNNVLLDQIKETDVLEEKVDLIMTRWPEWNVFIQGHGLPKNQLESPLILSLIPSELNSLLVFFNTLNIKTLTLSSCYSGGKNSNAIQLKKDLNDDYIQENINYTLGLASGTDARATVWIDEKSMFESGFSFKNFFKTIETENARNYEKALLLLAENEGTVIAENIPQIFYPHVGWASALANKKLQKITTVSMRKAGLEGGTIEVDPDVQTLMLYPEIIHVPIDITLHGNNYSHIVSMQKGNALHCIKTLNVVSDINLLDLMFNFLPNTFLYMQTRESRVTFFIETLTFCNETNVYEKQAFTNVMIETEAKRIGASTVVGHSHDFSYKVLFTYGGYTYFIEYTHPNTHVKQQIDQGFKDFFILQLGLSLFISDPKVEDGLNTALGMYLGKNKTIKMNNTSYWQAYFDIDNKVIAGQSSEIIVKYYSKKFLEKNEKNKETATQFFTMVKEHYPQITDFLTNPEEPQEVLRFKKISKKSYPLYGKVNELKESLFLLSQKLQGLHQNLRSVVGKLSGSVKEPAISLSSQVKIAEMFHEDIDKKIAQVIAKWIPDTEGSLYAAQVEEGISPANIRINIQNACNQVLNTLISTPLALFENNLQVTLNDLALLFLKLDADAQLNFVTSLCNKLGYLKLDKMVQKIYLSLNKNNVLFNFNTVEGLCNYNLVAIGTHIFVHKPFVFIKEQKTSRVDLPEIFSPDTDIQQFFAKVYMEMFSLKTIKINKLSTFLLAETCYFLAFINLGGGMYDQSVFRQILPDLPISSYHKVKILLLLRVRQAGKKGLVKEFAETVNGQKCLIEFRRKYLDKLSNREKALFNEMV